MINYILNFFIGLSLFLFGINSLTSGLKKINKDKFSRIIKQTNNKYKGVFWGTIITAIVQSSSFITVLLVSLVDSNIISLNNSIGLIMGSNIGTCITSWILSLSSIGNNFLTFLSIDNLLGIIAILSLFFFFKKRLNKAQILFGLIILILGMNLMSESMMPLSESSTFQTILKYFENPILGLISGIIITAIFQSSSLVIGILESLSIGSNISFLAGYTIILGSNIGTCITALIASTNTSKTSKVVSMFHLVFNIIGTLIFIIGFYLLNYLFDFTFTYQTINAFHIAIIHTIFNLGSTIILLPFTNHLIIISKKLIKSGSGIL